MKKREPSSKSEFIRNVVVYRENLEEIIQLFLTKEMQISISDSRFEYSDLDEVAKQQGFHVQELDISGHASGRIMKIYFRCALFSPIICNVR